MHTPLSLQKLFNLWTLSPLLSVVRRGESLIWVFWCNGWRWDPTASTHLASSLPLNGHPNPCLGHLLTVVKHCWAFNKAILLPISPVKSGRTWAQLSWDVRFELMLALTLPDDNQPRWKAQGFFLPDAQGSLLRTSILCNGVETIVNNYLQKKWTGLLSPGQEVTSRLLSLLCSWNASSC